MAKILFISDSFLDESLGLMYLSSYLKSKGHATELVLLSEYRHPDKLLKEIEDINPDIIGFSVMTPQVDAFRPVTKLVKEKTGRKIVWGGPHCIFMPENVAADDSVDVICIGEGEEALCKLMDRVGSGQDYSDIPGLWVRQGPGWKKNDIGYLEEDLDKYPYPDRELYYKKYPLLRNFGVKRLITQRGCPYDCSYCFEPMFRDLYKGKGKLVRRHSVEHVIGEARDIISRYPTGTIHFSDDTFNINKAWVIDFLARYRTEIKKPFTCNVTVLMLDDDVVRNLKESGCNGVVFGLECGIEETRMNLLNKKIPDKRYMEACELLKKHNLKFVTNMIFCLPNETVDSAIKSISFDVSLKPYGVKANILKIYKGTNLAQFLVDKNMCGAVGEFTYKPKDPNNEHESIKNMIWAGYLFLKFPILLKFARQILTGSFMKVFSPVVTLLSYWQDVKFFRIPLGQSLLYFWHSRKTFVEGVGKGQADHYSAISKSQNKNHSNSHKYSHISKA